MDDSSSHAKLLSTLGKSDWLRDSDDPTQHAAIGPGVQPLLDSYYARYIMTSFQLPVQRLSEKAASSDEQTSCEYLPSIEFRPADFAMELEKERWKQGRRM
jgi:hypothetical protein